MPARSLIYISILVSTLLLPKVCIAGGESASRDQPLGMVKVRALRFRTPVPLLPSERQKLMMSLRRAGWRFSQPQSPDFHQGMVEELLREVYEDEGYFKPEVSEETVPVRGQGRNVVDLLLRVNPGTRYRLTNISWVSVTVFSQVELAKLVPFRGGDWLSRIKIANGLDAARKLYYSKGYINFTCIPTPQINEEARTISFLIDVDEGAQFRFGQLTADGMQEEDRRLLLSAWDDLRGRPYSADVADKFFNRFFTSPLPKITPKDYVVRKFDAKSRSVNYSLQVTLTSLQP
ncbi:MAG: POTRA domain-containing protein [Terriglobales bacterium]